MLHAARIRKLYLYRAGISKAEIARRSKLPRTSVRRVPCHGFFPEVGRATRYARLPKAHNVWSNPELTCQHVDPQAALSPGEEAILETKILVVRGSSLNEVFEMAMKQRDSLEQ